MTSELSTGLARLGVVAVLAAAASAAFGAIFVQEVDASTGCCGISSCNVVTGLQCANEKACGGFTCCFSMC